MKTLRDILESLLDAHQKYAYKFKYYRNNILFSAEWANGTKVPMKFVPQ